MRHSMKGFAKSDSAKDHLIQTMSFQIQELQKKVNEAKSGQAELEEANKMMNFQLQEMNQKLHAQEEQLNDAEEQLNDAESELEDAGMMKGKMEEQEYELMRRMEEIKQLNKRISELKQDIFYRNKNVFDHNLLKMELENKRQETDALKGRVRDLEENCASLRIQGEVAGEDPIDQENHFTKKIFKLETKINDMKRENEELRKLSRGTGQMLANSMISARSSQKDFYGKKKKKTKKVLNDLLEESDSGDQLREMRRRVSRAELEKKIYQEKNVELTREVEILRGQNISQAKVANHSLIDDKEFKKRLNKVRIENHQLKDQLHEMETKLRNWETEQRLNNDRSRSRIETNSANDQVKTDQMNRKLEEKDRRIKSLEKERDALKKELDRVKFDLEELEKEKKTLEYRLMGEEDNDQKVEKLVEKNVKLGERVLELEGQIKKMFEAHSMNSGYPDKEIDKILES